MPTMDSQRGDAAVSRSIASGSGMPKNPQSPHSRRHRRSAAAGGAAGRRAVISTLRCRSPAAPLRPRAQPVPVRVGGFGGAAGLADYLLRERIDALIDATHPYATVDLGERRRGRAQSRRAVRGVAPAAMGCRRRRPVDRSERRARCGASARDNRPAASSSRSAATNSRRSPARRSTII